MARSNRLISLLIATTLAAAAVPRVAFAADPQEQQLAQALFEEGRSLMDKKRYHDACAKFAESQRLDPAGGTQLNLAICYEKDGKLATAKVIYEEALASAIAGKRRDRQVIAKERLAAIEKDLPHLRIVVPLSSDMEGLEVKLDGMIFRRAAWGVATATDPGSHTLEVTGPNRTPWTSTVPLERSENKTVEVPQLAPLAALAPAAVPTPAPPAVLTEPQPSDLVLGSTQPEPYRMLPEPKRNPVYYTALGVTLVGGALMAVTGILAVVADKSAKDGCLPDRKYCSSEDSSNAADRAHTFAWVSTISLGVAAVGFVTLLIAPAHLHAEAAAVKVSPTVGVGPLGLSGSF